jgi:predicted small lipoprotein YifL
MKPLLRCGAVLLAAVLAGCGQKGPLYVPDDSTPVLVTPAAPVSVVPEGTTPQAERTKSSK